jgi:hypothetical protein
MVLTIAQKFAAALLIGTFACTLAACEEHEPAEEIGETLDDSAEDTDDAVEDATD